MTTHSIYWLEDKKGVPFYVGQTTNVNQRLSCHRSKFKTDLINLFVIESCTSDNALELE